MNWKNTCIVLCQIYSDNRCQTLLTSYRRAAASLYPRPSPPSVGAEAPRAAEPTSAPAYGNVAVGSHAQYVPTLTAAAA